MGLFSWITGSGKAAPHSVSSDLNSTFNAESTRPFRGASSLPQNPSHARTAAALSSATATARSEQRRTERNARRELLFQVVRESMLRVGVLSSGFKFKVLALDQRGRQFLVIIDLSSEFTGHANKLGQIESLISQSAKSRYELIVQAVYWRFYENANAANTPGAVESKPLAGAFISRPDPLSGSPMSRPAPLSGSPISRPAPLSGLPISAPPGRDEPLQRDEVEAFKRALASGTMGADAQRAMPAGSRPTLAEAANASRLGANSVLSARAEAEKAAAAKAAALAAIHNKLLLTGYEDTEMHDDIPPELSGTQYGDLRE